MKLIELFQKQGNVINEGGNAFPDVTPFDHKHIPGIMKILDGVLKPTGTRSIPIGSGATPTPGKVSGDIDIIVDQDTLAQYFNINDAKSIRKALRALYDQAGYDTNQSGISVHVRVPIGNEAHQADIMVVPNAEQVAGYHKHTIPADSQYKGKHKMIAMSKLANSKGMMWSGFQGLFKRDENGKKAELLSTNLDEIASYLLNPNATAKDLGSLETILAALPQDQAEHLKAELEADPNT